MRMKSWILAELIRPMVRRLGTGLGAFLAGAGVAAEPIQQIQLGVAAAAAVGIELLLSNRERKK